MATSSEQWYVRLPDGRTLRARNAEVVRTYLRAGRIPTASRVRRTGVDAWQPLERVAEFAHAAAAETPAAHGELRAIGVRALLNELCNAFDSCMDRTKLTVAALLGLALAVGMIAIDVIGELPAASWTPFAYLGVAVFLLGALSLATVLLTQLTVIELDRHRPARPAEVRAGLGRHWLRVFVAQGVVGAVLIGLVVLCRLAVPWLAVHDLGDLNALRDAAANVAAVLRPVIEVVCWPLLALALLQLGPMLVVEEYSIARSLREWLGMVRRHLGRIYLYEAIAFVFALVLALPLLLAVGAAAWSGPEASLLVERTALLVLAGLALTPLFAYLLVANVFIYLNLRYEFFFSARER